MITSVGRLSGEQVRAVLHAADAAPSPHGDRPWRFRCSHNVIELYESGPTGPDRLLASGGALFNLRLAVQDLGVSADVRLAPDPDNPALLAAVRTENERLATTWERQLALASVRAPSAAVATAITPAAALPELRRASEIEQAWLAPLGADDAAGIGAPPGSLVVVIGSLHEDRRALLRAGQAIRRIVLTSATLGLHTTVLPEPVASAGARARLRSRIGGALFPHAVLALHN